MQVRHQPLFLCDSRDQVGVRLDGIDRRQPQTRQIRHKLQHRAHELAQRHRAGKILAIGRHIDAGQHDFGVAVLDQTAHLRHHLARRHGARRTRPNGMMQKVQR